MLRGRSEALRGQAEDAQRTFRGRSEALKGPLEALTGRSGAFKGRSEALRGRSEDVQATLRGRSEDVQRRSGAFRRRSEAAQRTFRGAQRTSRRRLEAAHGWWDPDPMAMVERGPPAEFPNRLFSIVYFSQKIIIFGYFLHFRHCREGFKATFRAAFLHFPSL